MSLKFRYYTRLLRAFLKRFAGIIVIGLVIGIVIFLAFTIIIPQLANKDEVIGLQGRYNTTNLPKKILRLIGSGLTKVAKNGKLEPDLALSWKTLDEGKTWEFKLDTSKVWQDGKNIESSDINYSFSDLEVRRPDSKTIVFTLSEKYSLFPHIVSKPTFKKGLLGVGEWEAKKIVLNGPYIDTLQLRNKAGNKRIFKFFPTEDLAKTMFKMGKVDSLTEIFNPKPFDEWETVSLKKKYEKNKIVVIFFNTQDPLLSDKSFRQALYYAVDKQSFSGIRALSPISPDSYFYNPQVKNYEHNPDRSNKIIKNLPSEQKEDLKINLVTTPILLSEAERVSDFWKSVGVETNVLVSSVVPEDFQAYLTILDTPQSPDQYSLWHSTQEGTNISNYSNPRIDKLLEEGRRELDTENQRAIYLDFQRFLLEDAPAAFLFHPEIFDVVRK